MTITVGSICTGYGGLELAFDLAGVDHTLAWCSEIDPSASTILEHRFPGVPNLGDINDAQPEPVDLITAGFPCQDISTAGQRAGLDGERSGLWWRIRDVVGDLRPRWVLLENVAAITSLGGTAVVGSLAELGYCVRWTIVRASDVGAPHQRARWFCLAGDTHGTGLEGRPAVRQRAGQRSAGTASVGAASHPDGAGWVEQVGQSGGETSPAAYSDRPATTDTKGERFERAGVARSRWDGSAHSSHVVADSNGSGQQEFGIGGLSEIGDAQPRSDVDRCGSSRFGAYAPAVRRWERLTRPAPPPTMLYAGKHKLNPAFSEWMMGLPAGWVTDFGLMDTDPRPDHLSRAQMLRVLGNGVVPQQAAAGLHLLTEPG